MKIAQVIAILIIFLSTMAMLWILFSPMFAPKKEIPIAESILPPAPTAVPEADIIPVRVIKIMPRDFEDTLSAMGTIRGYQEIELRFETSATIKKINVKEGEKVLKGDILASLDDSDAQLKLQYSRKKLEAAQAQSNSANKKKELYEGLYRAGAIIKQKLDEAVLEAEAVKAQMGMAEAEIKLAESELKKTLLVSPKEGVIGAKEVEEGELVTPRERILSLYDLEKVYAELGIVEREVEKVKFGQKTEITLDSYPQDIFIGNIEKIIPVIEGRSRTLTVKVLLENPRSILLPGMFCRAKVYLKEIRNSIFVPKTSVLILGPGNNVVPVIDPLDENREALEQGTTHGVIRLKRVAMSYVTNDFAYISKGIEAGELVVIEAKGELKEDVKAKVVGIESPTF